jgi:hypothetical protein
MTEAKDDVNFQDNPFFFISVFIDFNFQFVFKKDVLEGILLILEQ